MTPIGHHSPGTTNSRLVIIQVDNPLDSRLDAFRWRDRQLASKSDRRETVGAGLFVAEGDLVVRRALAARHSPVALLCEESTAHELSAEVNADIPIYVANEDVRRDVTGLGVPLRATGLFQRPPLIDARTLISQSQRILIAEAVDNPTNLGAIVRSAAGLGWDGLLLSDGSADPLARRALRVSMGTALTFPFARLEPHESLHNVLAEHSVVSIALTPDPTAIDIASLAIAHDTRIALLMGSERDGLHEESLQRATHMVRIPMHAQVDSLNVGVAAAIAMYALAKN